MRNIVLLIILALAFCLNELTLTYFLPLAKSDFDVWLKYFIAKDATYDAMFFIFSLVTFSMADTRGTKSVCTFLVIVTGGSFIDKVIFDMNQYLPSDVALICLGILFSTITYVRYGRFKKLDT
jgi:hypothetical protein